LEEILDDTVKHVTVVGKDSVQHSWQRMKNNSMKSQPDESKEQISIRKDGDNSFIDVNSRLPADKTQEQWTMENESKSQFAKVSIGEGYVNPAFVGSTNELTSLDFDCSARKHSKRMHLEKSIRLFIIPLISFSNPFLYTIKFFITFVLFLK